MLGLGIEKQLNGPLASFRGRLVCGLANGAPPTHTLEPPPRSMAAAEPAGDRLEANSDPTKKKLITTVRYGSLRLKPRQSKGEETHY